MAIFSPSKLSFWSVIGLDIGKNGNPVCFVGHMTVVFGTENRIELFNRSITINQVEVIF